MLNERQIRGDGVRVFSCEKNAFRGSFVNGSGKRGRGEDDDVDVRPLAAGERVPFCVL